MRTSSVLTRVPLLAALLAALAAAGGVPARAEGEAPEVSRLLRDLASEAESIRDRASARLESVDGLRPEDVAGALRAASARERPPILRLAAARKMTGLIADIAQVAAGADAVTAQAALRALVTFGPEGVAAGRAAVASSKELSDAERAPRARHLEALDAQRRVEHEVLSRWRRKGGSYRGRYSALAELGFPVQPVLVGMLLDIPLEDQFLVVPPPVDPALARDAQKLALFALARSPRRGYRTFEPLPSTIEPDELFDLAGQALADVGDMELVAEILEDVHRELMRTHNDADWRPRQWEDHFALELEFVLAARGAPQRLDERRERLEEQARAARTYARRARPEESSDAWHYYSVRLSELAGVLHQLGRFDDAAKRYEEILRIGRLLTGKDSAISAYNRACALARAGRKDEALDALSRALDPSLASGFEDLTREWVCEDGDLASLRDDPRFESALRKRFGGD